MFVGPNLGLSENNPAKSGYDILQKNKTVPSGSYWIKTSTMSSSQKMYVDMVTSGGGWTLVVCSDVQGSAWNTTTVLSMNSSTPSINSNYSILNLADSLKTNLSGKLNYRIDAEAFGTWGGIWEADYDNTFTATSMSNTIATNLVKWNTWSINTNASGTNNALSNRMPWIDNNTQLLTTWNDTGSWWGTLASGNGSYHPAPYISPQKQQPGIIWYWVK
tara:strand:+ start:2411 stop:3064 length:654 start_codon:yes stop_codon:yes gene_type:complete